MPAPIDLDRLLELWQAPRPSPLPPVPAPPAPEEAPRIAPAALGPAPPAPDPPPDPVALLAALTEAAARAWGQESKEFAIVGDLLETGGKVTTMRAMATPPRIGDLVRALFPAGGPPPPADDRARLQAALARQLDRLEDVLDALLMATEAR